MCFVFQGVVAGEGVTTGEDRGTKTEGQYVRSRGKAPDEVAWQRHDDSNRLLLVSQGVLGSGTKLSRRENGTSVGTGCVRVRWCAWVSESRWLAVRLDQSHVEPEDYG